MVITLILLGLAVYTLWPRPSSSVGISSVGDTHTAVSQHSAPVIAVEVVDIQVGSRS